MKPMLLCRDKPDLDTLKYPVMCFPKLDGIRCLVIDGVPKTRTLKDVPNKHIREELTKLGLGGYDGELIVGDAISPTVYRDTNSVVMSHDKVEHFYFFVFDFFLSDKGFHDRQQTLKELTRARALPDNIRVLQGAWCLGSLAVLDYEQEQLDKGYEGIIIRNPDAPYKQGRTTLKENNTYKLKRFEDGEAVIIGMEEEQHNANEATTNELGRTSRSIHKAGMVGKGTMGALIVQDLVSNIQFNIGSGFDARGRQHFWDNKGEFIGQIVKYKSFVIGVKDKPRHPIFLGMRSPEDM
jgi:DNA ligase-1